MTYWHEKKLDYLLFQLKPISYNVANGGDSWGCDFSQEEKFIFCFHLNIVEWFVLLHPKPEKVSVLQDNDIFSIFGLLRGLIFGRLHSEVSVLPLICCTQLVNNSEVFSRENSSTEDHCQSNESPSWRPSWQQFNKVHHAQSSSWSQPGTTVLLWTFASVTKQHFSCSSFQSSCVPNVTPLNLDYPQHWPLSNAVVLQPCRVHVVDSPRSTPHLF